MENATCDYNVLYNIYVPKGKRWHKIVEIKDTNKYDDIVQIIEKIRAENKRFKVTVGRTPILHFNNGKISTMMCGPCYDIYKYHCTQFGCCLPALICNSIRNDRRFNIKSFTELKEECKL